MAPDSSAKAQERQEASLHDSDPDMLAKEREKQLRKEAIQRHDSDPDLFAKDREKELRKQAIRRASVHGSDPDLFAKDREKQLRKQALQVGQPAKNWSPAPVASTQENDRKMPPAAAAAVTTPPVLEAKQSGDMAAKNREKQIRQEILQTQLSSRKLALAAAAVPTPPALEAKQSADMAAKNREKQIRQEILQTQLSARKLAPQLSSRKLAPAAAAVPAPPALEAKQSADMAAKNREKQIRQEILQTQLSSRKLAPAAAAAVAAPSASEAKQSADMAAKNREKQIRQEILQTQLSSKKLAPAAAATVTAPPASEAKQSADIAAKNREKQIRQEILQSQVPKIKMAPDEEKKEELEVAQTQAERDAASKRAAASGRAIAPIQDSTSQNVEDLDALAKQRAAAGRTPALNVGAFAAPNEPLDSALMVGAFAVPATPMQEEAPKAEMEASLRDDKPGFGTVDKGLGDDLVTGIQPLPETKELEAAVPGAYCSTVVMPPNPQVDEVVQDVEAPPLPQDDPSYPTIDGLSSINSGLIEATLVDDVVEATIATAYRDDSEEIRKQSAVETARVARWRILVCLALLVTAVAVTVSTYKILLSREDENFHNVYAQFAKAVSDAAVEQQSNLRDALRIFADTVSMTAAVYGNGTSPWPYFVMPRFQRIAADFKVLANAEFVGLQNYVSHEQRDSYIDFITPRYEDFVKESHIEAYGDLHFLDNDTSYYQPYIAQKLDNGSFVPDIDREFYFCRNTQSPPARKYGPTINNNLLVDQVIREGFAAVMKLRSEPVFTTIKPFANLPDDEHIKMHSNGLEGANNPHSFTFMPIHREIGDPQSDIVAMFAVATAWDVSMLNLLPDNVKGMYCVVQNTCNQTVTYRIDGGNATYLGEGELQNHEYNDMAVFVDLNLQVHPDAASTPGHCMYTMTIYPSKDFENDYKTNTPKVYAGVVAATFFVILIMYIIYDYSVTMRNEKMISNAAKTSAILKKLVPNNVRDRIMGFDQGAADNNDAGMGLSRKDWKSGMAEMEASKRIEHARRAGKSDYDV